MLILKWVHILLAIAAIGSNITYGIWLSRGARDPQHLAFALRGVKILDDRVANPAYVLLLITGVAMTFMADIPITTPWILTGLALYVAVALIGIFGYGPLLRRQIALIEADGLRSPEYALLSRLGMILGIVLALLTLAITFLMVVKPPLWA